MTRTSTLTAVLLLAAAGGAAAQDADPYLWLEDVEGAKATAWAAEQSKRTMAELRRVPEYAPTFERALAIYDSPDRIPKPALRGGLVYNTWQDAAHPRGLWRRATLESYATATPAWETVLDLDALGAKEGVPWVLGGVDCLAPEHRLCMVALSRGGSDAVEVRELDTATKSFVAGGFRLPEAKTSLAWKDPDTLWVATDYGPGSMTTSGYPRIVKEWRRGTPLAQARTVYAGDEADVGVWPSISIRPDGRHEVVVRGRTFYTFELYLSLGGRLVRLDVPEDASWSGMLGDRLVLRLRSAWKVGVVTHAEGALLAVDLDTLLLGRPRVDTLFEPTATSALASVATTRDAVVAVVLDNVRSTLLRLSPSDASWRREEVPLPGFGEVEITEASPDASDFFVTYQDFVTPPALLLVSGATPRTLKSLPAQFDASGVRVEQRWATSRDGMRIPYFLVTPKGFAASGSTPTLLYGYGGFEDTELPTYSGVVGSAWLQRGGVYALANLRGGGEFGPRWHNAALKENRIRSFEDLIAVAEDLVAARITSSRHLGIMGGSQGGLLVGGAFVLRPDLFGAVVCQVPLLDMKRYHLLLAGASWMAEYGNPDIPGDWASMKAWSPYQLVRPDVKYPRVLFWTTMRDDRVHPGHARKMVARMLEQGHPVLYFEASEGGHGSGAVNRQRATIRAVEYAYLWKTLR